MNHTHISEIMSLLLVTTKANRLQWKTLVGDAYRASAEARVYEIDWLYWYDLSGIALGRMGFVLSVNDCNVVLLRGVDDYKYAEALLNEIECKWKKYHLSIHEACHSMISKIGLTNSLAPEEQQCQLMLHLLLRASQNGLVKWVEDKSRSDSYYAMLGGDKIEVDFVSPADTHDRPLSRLIVSLTLPEVVMAYACGTEGYRLIEEMLSISIQSFSERLNQIDKILTVEIDFLKQLLKS